MSGDVRERDPEGLRFVPMSHEDYAPDKIALDTCGDPAGSACLLPDPLVRRDG